MTDESARGAGAQTRALVVGTDHRLGQAPYDRALALRVDRLATDQLTQLSVQLIDEVLVGQRIGRRRHPHTGSRFIGATVM